MIRKNPGWVEARNQGVSLSPPLPLILLLSPAAHLLPLGSGSRQSKEPWIYEIHGHPVAPCAPVDPSLPWNLWPFLPVLQGGSNLQPALPFVVQTVKTAQCSEAWSLAPSQGPWQPRPSVGRKMDPVGNSGGLVCPCPCLHGRRARARRRIGAPFCSASCLGSRSPGKRLLGEAA